MRYKPKHISYSVFTGIVLLLGIMFVLNKHLGNESLSIHPEQQKIEVTRFLSSGVTPASTQVPAHTEGSLPIKLIHNPSSNLVYILNRNFSVKKRVEFIHLKNRYYLFAPNLLSGLLCVIVSTSQNKDIQ